MDAFEQGIYLCMLVQMDSDIVVSSGKMFIFKVSYILCLSLLGSLLDTRLGPWQRAARLAR